MVLNQSDTSTSMTLEQWNSELVLKHLPVTSVLGVYMFLALLGNGTVVYIYLRRIRIMLSSGRFFIPVLAVIDMVSGVANTAANMSLTIFPATFYSDTVCKITLALCVSTTASSISVLFVIAIDRYLIFCKQRQLTIKRKKISIILCIVIGVIVSFPCFSFYGTKPVTKYDINLTGRRCTCVSGGHPRLAVAYNAFLLLVSITMSIMLTLMYMNVGKVIFKRSHYEEDPTPDPDIPTCTSTQEPASRTVVNTPPNEGRESGVATSQEMDTIETRIDQTPVPIRTTSRQNVNRRGITIMFMVITIIFMICFIPKTTWMVVESINTDFWVQLSDEKFGGFMFLYTVYIINNIINPCIYSCMDTQFQTELKKLCNRSMIHKSRHNMGIRHDTSITSIS